MSEFVEAPKDFSETEFAVEPASTFQAQTREAQAYGGWCKLSREPFHRVPETAATIALPSGPRPVIFSALACMFRALTADESFVSFDFTRRLVVRVVLRGESNSLEHELRGLLGHVERAMKFPRRDAVFAVESASMSPEATSQAGSESLQKSFQSSEENVGRECPE